MKIYLRLSESYKKQIKITKNSVFVSKTSESITLFPVPPFLKDPKCKCGKKTEFMLEDMSCTCSKCVNKPLAGVRLETEDDVSIPLTKYSIRNIKFEWSVNGDRWYTVYGRGLKPRYWDKFLVKLKDMILHDKELSLEADYDKDKKEMTIY